MKIRTVSSSMKPTLELAFLAVLVLGLLSNGSTPGMAKSRRSAVPPSATPITTCGTTISTPGSYVLGNNLNCSADGVDITTSDVTLSLASFSMSGGGGSKNGILVSNPAGGTISNVRILGPGAVSLFANAISFAGVQDSQLTGFALTDSQTCILLNSDSQRDASLHNLFSALSTFDCGVGVQGNSVNDSNFTGNVLTDGTHGLGACISILSGNGNVLSGNVCAGGTIGIELGGTGSTGATGNLLFGNTTAGTFGENTTGILVGSRANGNKFEANDSTGNTLDIDEENSGCGTDFWRRNVFLSSNQGCVH